MTPRFKHDCTACTFLGRFEAFDLYHCTVGPLPTVIGRYGEGGSYTSGLPAAERPDIHPELAEAKRRATALGLDCVWPSSSQ